MRQDNRGITLLEIIIAIATSVIVVGAVTLFIRNALKSYQLASDTIDLQMESQVFMEQLATWTMEGNYYVVPAGGDGIFIIYHIPRLALDSDMEGYMGEFWARIFWQNGKEELYSYKANKDEFNDMFGGTIDLSKMTDLHDLDKLTWALKDDWESPRYQVSDHVETFEVTADNSIKPADKISVTLVMKAVVQNYEHRYELTDDIYMRNALLKPPAEESEESEVPEAP